jgi:hypothetical protein
MDFLVIPETRTGLGNNLRQYNLTELGFVFSFRPAQRSLLLCSFLVSFSRSLATANDTHCQLSHPSASPKSCFRNFFCTSGGCGERPCFVCVGALLVSKAPLPEHR